MDEPQGFFAKGLRPRQRGQSRFAEGLVESSDTITAAPTVNESHAVSTTARGLQRQNATRTAVSKRSPLSNIQSRIGTLNLGPSLAEGMPWLTKASTNDTSKSQSTAAVKKSDSIRSRAWSWSSRSTKIDAVDPEATPEVTHLGPARCEIWPWSRHDSHFDSLQMVSRTPSQAPNRQEIVDYANRPLPPPPPPSPAVQQQVEEQITETATNRMSINPTLSSARQSMLVNEMPRNPDDLIYRSEEISNDLKWNSKQMIKSEKQSTWVSRLERRAAQDKKGRELTVLKE